MPAPITVAVIPCAGAGSRMRPATRVVPKPLIPVVDRPVIQYVVEEAVAAGVTEVILVVDERPGNPVLAHFVDGDPVPGLESVHFEAVVQSEPHGLGDAVLRARGAVDGRPFACLLSDMFPRPGRSFTPRLVGLYDGRPVLAMRRVGPEFFDRSDLGLVGRYVLTPEIFDDLDAIEAGHGGEVQLTDAIDRAARRRGALGLIVGDDLLDIGRPAGLLEATAVVGLSRPDLAEEFRQALDHLLAD
jgi:UTP--glucose-1-phosphate uridylyltransferase